MFVNWLVVWLLDLVLKRILWVVQEVYFEYFYYIGAAGDGADFLFCIIWGAVLLLVNLYFYVSWLDSCYGISKLYSKWSTYALLYLSLE